MQDIDPDDKALKEWLGRTVTGGQSAPEQAYALLGWYLKERVPYAAYDSGDPLAQYVKASAADHQVLSYAARKCLDAAVELLREMCVDEELPLESRLMAARTLVCLSWVTFHRLGPSEFESLIEESMQSTDFDALGELSSFFQQVCECDPLWIRWKTVVRQRLAQLADKLQVDLLRPPKRRTECRLVAEAARHAAKLRSARALLELVHEREVEREQAC